MKTNVHRRLRRLSWLLILLAPVACHVTDSSKTETYTGVLQEAGGGASFFLPIGKAVEARVTWTVPAEGTRPVAVVRFETLGLVGDTIQESAPSDTPPVVFRGSGDFIVVACLNCHGLAPIPFTLTVTQL